MEAIFDFMKTHAVLISAIFAATTWYVWIQQYPSRSLFRLIAFPIFHWQDALNIRKFPAAFPIMLGYLFTLCGVIELIFSRSPIVFLCCWGIILVYELLGVVSYLLKINLWWKWMLWGLIALSLNSYTIMKSIQIRDYKPMSDLDFIIGTFLFCCSLIIVIKISLQGTFAINLEAFFVFFGLVIYFPLQNLATIMNVFDVILYWDYSYASVLILYAFWLLSVPWIRHLRYKFT